MSDEETEFDPTKEPPKKDYGDSTPLPHGRYLMALVYFRQKRGKESGKPYLGAKFEVIGGPGKGRATWWNVSLTAGRMLWSLCQAIGQTERFSLTDKKAISAALKGKPFVVDLVLNEKDNGWKENYPERFYAQEEWTDLERELALAWLAEQAAAKTGGDFLDEPHRNIPQDDDKIPF